MHLYGANAYSPVFQSLLSLETSSTPELRLCDSSIEAQHTIRIVLDLIYGKPLQAPTRCFQKLKNTYDVLMKYDCAAALQTYKMAVRAWAVDTKANKLSVFIIGAHMDDVEACATALQRDGHSMWRSTKEVEDLDDLVHLDDTEGIPPSLMAPQVAGYCFDPTSLTFDIYDAIPRVYMLALIHATDPSDHDCEDCCCSGGHCSFEHVDLNQASETFRVMLNSYVCFVSVSADKETTYQITCQTCQSGGEGCRMI